MLIHKYIVEHGEMRLALKFWLLRHKIVIGGNVKYLDEMKDILSCNIEDLGREDVPKRKDVTPNKCKIKLKNVHKGTWDELIDNLEDSPLMVYRVKKHGRLMR